MASPPEVPRSGGAGGYRRRMGIRAQMETIATATTSMPPRLKRRTIRLDDGHRVGLAICGEGVPLVMVHGIIAEGMLYARTLRRLAGMGFRVIAVDSAGHGRTDGLGRRGWDWSNYIELHERVMDHLGIERAVLMGHSMGGRVVVDLASRQPERAIAVIPINAAIGSSSMSSAAASSASASGPSRSAPSIAGRLSAFSSSQEWSPPSTRIMVPLAALAASRANGYQMVRSWSPWTTTTGTSCSASVRSISSEPWSDAVA